HDAFHSREVSFRALDALCDGVAGGLRLAGLNPGARIAVLSSNRHEFVATVLGAMRAGVIPVPINIKLPAESVRYIVEDAGAQIIFAEAPYTRLCPDGVKRIEFDATFDAFIAHDDAKAFEPAPDVGCVVSGAGHRRSRGARPTATVAAAGRTTCRAPTCLATPAAITP
ncbi:MAG: AMP-binding protein, partial [Pseudomonadota bacterium]